MHVIGHNHVSANGPSMPFMSRTPFTNKDFRSIIVSKDFLSMLCARCDEINRSSDPNTFESPQMLMHAAVVAEGVDLGNLRCGNTHGRGQRPRLQLQRLQR